MNNRLILGLATLFTITALIFNHFSIDLAWYDQGSSQQRESIIAGQLATIGPLAYSINGEFGTVSAPPSFANDLRAWTIDVILLGQLLLIAKLLKK